MAPAEPSEDGLLDGRVRLFQPRRGYRVAVDPVLLAAAAPVSAGESVLDAGTGTAAAALCLLWRVPACAVTGLERDPDLLTLARRGADANGTGGRLRLVEGDLLARPGPLAGAAFDHVITNPPFHPAGAATPPATATGRAAHLAEAGVGAWLDACLRRLRPGGRLTLIHGGGHIDTIMAALVGRAGGITLCPLWPMAAAAAAKRVIVAARKGSRAPARLLRGMVLHEPDGRFTAEADAVLRHGRPLPIDL